MLSFISDDTEKKLLDVPHCGINVLHQRTQYLVKRGCVLYMKWPLSRLYLTFVTPTRTLSLNQSGWHGWDHKSLSFGVMDFIIWVNPQAQYGGTSMGISQHHNNGGKQLLSLISISDTVWQVSIPMIINTLIPVKSRLMMTCPLSFS